MASARSSTTTLSSPQLNPVTPMESSRYKPTETLTIPKKPSNPTFYERGTHAKGDRDVKIHGLDALPGNWEQSVHPDGKLYFRNLAWNAVTEVDIRDPVKLLELEAWYTNIHNVRLSTNAELCINAELYLALDPLPGYYFVDHGTQQIFWIETLPLDRILPEGDRSSVELFILQNYYRHLEHFPCYNVLPRDGVDFLRGTLIYACTDHMTSGESATAPWSAEECKTFLELLDSIKDSESRNMDSKAGVHDGYNVWFVSRLICVILHGRLLHRYGTYDACIDRLLPIKPSSLRFIDLVAGAASFCAHFSYMRRLDNVWAQNIVSTTGWRSLMTTLLIEWADSNLLATVMLSANMAFLALSDIGPVERTSSVVSAFFSIGSLAVGLHHVWRHRIVKDSDATQASIYFQNASRIAGSPRLLSFFLCLPLVLLSWSLLTFGCSVALYAFHRSLPSISYFVTGPVFALILGAAIATVVFFRNMFVYGGQ